MARGYRVLIVDADRQGTARTWAAVAQEFGKPTPTVVCMYEGMDGKGQLDALAPTFDVTLVDCPPGDSKVNRSALLSAHLAVIPCGPSAVDVWSMAEPVELIKRALDISPVLKARALITRKVKRTTIGAGAREALSSLGLEVLRSELGFRVAYQEAPAAGLGVAQYAPRDPAAGEVRELVDEMLEVINGEAGAKIRSTETPRRDAGPGPGKVRTVHRGRRKTSKSVP
jgi:chromosome partitioning protein